MQFAYPSLLAVDENFHKMVLSAVDLILQGRESAVVIVPGETVEESEENEQKILEAAREFSDQVEVHGGEEHGKRVVVFNAR